MNGQYHMQILLDTQRAVYDAVTLVDALLNEEGHKYASGSLYVSRPFNLPQQHKNLLLASRGR